MRREEEVWKTARQSIVSIPFDKPVFMGYKMFHVVRDDITRSPWAEQAALILPYVNHVIYCRRKDFLYKDRDTKKMVPVKHDLLPIWGYIWKRDKLDEVWPAHIVAKFGPEYVIHRHYAYRWFWGHPWWFVSKISRHYATHYRDVNGTLESERQRIHEKLQQEHAWRKLYGRGDHCEGLTQDPFDSTNWHLYLDRLMETGDGRRFRR
jgi:hypothetical protein